MTAGLLPSAEAELRNRPQAEKSTEWTACLWPRKSLHTRPVAISHTSTAMDGRTPTAEVSIDFGTTDDDEANALNDTIDGRTGKIERIMS